MSGLFVTLMVVHILAAIGIIGLVLLQHGKGADMGAAFGSGASGSLFGATGSANFLSRTTAVLALLFFITSLSLAYFATHKPKEGGGVMEPVKAEPAGKTTVPLETPSQSPTIPVPSPSMAPVESNDSKAKESKDTNKK